VGLEQLERGLVELLRIVLEFLLQRRDLRLEFCMRLAERDAASVKGRLTVLMMSVIR